MLLTRLTKTKATLLSHQIHFAFISKKETLFYLTGLAPQHPTEREAFLLISPQNTTLCHSPFIDLPETTRQLINCVPMTTTSLSQLAISIFSAPNPVIGIEKNNLTLAEYERLQASLPQAHFVSIDSHISTQTIIKDPNEQQLLMQAGQIAAKVIRKVHSLLLQPNQKAGLTEIQLAHFIDHELVLNGADGPAFPTIVAFDAHSANPHHIPNSTPLGPNSIVLIDMGADFQHYKSDLTRTWKLGRQSQSQFSAVKKAVMTSYQQAVRFASSAKTLIANQLDAQARTVIGQAGFGPKFIHSTGHGIGLEAHEAPHINPTDHSPIQTNTAFTIEPGIYLPGQFGYRHENSFLLTSSRLICTTV